MRTLIFIVAGIVVFVAIYLLARLLAGDRGAAAMALKVFLPVWFIIAAINLTIGVRTAGYTVLEELPIFLIVFGVPAAAALIAWWRLGRA